MLFSAGKKEEDEVGRERNLNRWWWDMDCFGAVESDEAIHGPRASAERLSRRVTRQQLEAGRDWLKYRAAKLDKQQPQVAFYSIVTTQRMDRN